MLSHPFSVGSVQITSADPRPKPKIDFNYHAHPLGMEKHARLMQVLHRLAAPESLASCAVSGGRRLPREDPADVIDDHKEVVRAYAKTNHHPCGTWSLGAVVDDRSDVKGVRTLRVIDASILPVIPRGDTITTDYAVAERAADLISEDFGYNGHT